MGLGYRVWASWGDREAFAGAGRMAWSWGRGPSCPFSLPGGPGELGSLQPLWQFRGELPQESPQRQGPPAPRLPHQPLPPAALAAAAPGGRAALPAPLGAPGPARGVLSHALLCLCLQTRDLLTPRPGSAHPPSALPTHSPFTCTWNFPVLDFNKNLISTLSVPLPGGGEGRSDSRKRGSRSETLLDKQDSAPHRVNRGAGWALWGGTVARELLKGESWILGSKGWGLPFLVP